MHLIKDPKVQQTLNRLHKAAAGQAFTLMKGLSKGLFRKLRPEDMEDAYMPISRSQGAFIYDLLVRKGAKNIIEFGTSFGISTLYLAAAARENGGMVITTELLASKCKEAQRNFDDADLSKHIDLREGDALKTLSTDVPKEIDFLLLDGWNDLYLPLLQLLEPQFSAGALIYTDNASFKSAKPFLEYLKMHPNKYQTRRMNDDKGGSELTEFIGQ